MTLIWLPEVVLLDWFEESRDKEKEASMPASTLMVVVPAVLANWWPCAPPADTTLDFGNASEAAAAVGVVAARAKRRNVATATRRISPIKILLGLRDERDRAALGKASSVAMPSGRF